MPQQRRACSVPLLSVPAQSGEQAELGGAMEFGRKTRTFKVLGKVHQVPAVAVVLADDGADSTQKRLITTQQPVELGALAIELQQVDPPELAELEEIRQRHCLDSLGAG
jgi:hypothetical protein